MSDKKTAQEAQENQISELPVFNSGGWISTLVAIPKPNTEVEYYWRHFSTDEERIYVCTCSFDGESTTFSIVNEEGGWTSQYEEFWRPKNLAQHTTTLTAQLKELQDENERLKQAALDIQNVAEKLRSELYKYHWADDLIADANRIVNKLNALNEKQ